MIKLNIALPNTPQPSFPTSKFSAGQPSFKADDDDLSEEETIEKIKIEQSKLNRLAHDNNQPPILKKIYKGGEIVTGMALGGFSMKYGMKTSIEWLPKILEKPIAIKAKKWTLKSAKGTLKGLKYVGEKLTTLCKKINEIESINKITSSVNNKIEKINSNKKVASFNNWINDIISNARKSYIEYKNKFINKKDNIKEQVINVTAGMSAVAGGVEANKTHNDTDGYDYD